jgi:cell division septation protein DedD
MPPSSHYKTGSPPRGAVFLQVAAVALIDAKAEAEGLASKGFPIWVVPNERTADLFSILVGPYTDRAELSKAKASLEQLGFRKAFRKEIK